MVKIVLKKQIKGRRFPKPFSFLSRPDRFVDKAYTVPFINGYAAISTEKIERLIQKTNSAFFTDALAVFHHLFNHKEGITEP